jgi:phenol hydroxylase P2 protein
MAKQNKVFVIFQDTEDSRPFVDAFEQENTDASIEYLPGLVRIEAEGRLGITQEVVSEIAGREVDLQEMHIVLVSLSGSVDEDEDGFSVAWG